MNSKRLLSLCDLDSDGTCVVYVMSRDQRVQDNHALTAAQHEAIEKGVPLYVVFNLLKKTGFRTASQYHFMIEGLKEVQGNLADLNIGFILSIGDPLKSLQAQLENLAPATIYYDFNPLRGPRQLQKQLSSKLAVKSYVVDTHNITPLWVLSDKEEYAAHTIRRKVHKNLEEWLVETDPMQWHPHDPNITLVPNWKEAEQIASSQAGEQIDYEFAPGEKAGQTEIQRFIDSRLDGYAKGRNLPTLDQQSNLSPYLHFGHISSLRVALEVIKTTTHAPLLFREGKLASYEGEPTRDDSINAFLEELIVRKELADNFCFYNENYDNLNGAKDWAHKTLDDHSSDPREHVYSRDQWEQANTHDAPWNAAQGEMARTGKMHGYMRMYWAKKILEWSASPQEALETAIYLNDTYSIDGGDPNGYTGIMWSIAGIHDRPWFEREVYGKVRYMNQSGLKKRFSVDEYVAMWT